MTARRAIAAVGWLLIAIGTVVFLFLLRTTGLWPIAGLPVVILGGILAARGSNHP